MQTGVVLYDRNRKGCHQFQGRQGMTYVHPYTDDPQISIDCHYTQY